MSRKNLQQHLKNKVMKSELKGPEKVQHQIDRIFENHLAPHLSPFAVLNQNPFIEPSIEVSEDSKGIDVSAELPGLKAEEIDVNISRDGYLTISGEKKEEETDHKNGYYFSERSYGLFQRTIPLPTDIDTEHVLADFENGVLSVHIPKIQEAQSKLKKVCVRQKK